MAALARRRSVPHSEPRLSSRAGPCTSLLKNRTPDLNGRGQSFKRPPSTRPFTSFRPYSISSGLCFRSDPIFYRGKLSPSNFGSFGALSSPLAHVCLNINLAASPGHCNKFDCDTIPPEYSTSWNSQVSAHWVMRSM
ncbi:hypothetical protein OG21DRAFT_943123 [Imleria badia]|nr:hypothetical protein OG21DRAFT_943123 [Imleria badia]